MGESSACFVRSLSQPSPTSSDEKKVNHVQRALTTSISFGRFMSESLDWVKWSAFTQNRYMEEVEKYSKPGSVAEKKAYFEAHFKRRRAAALLEQQNAASNAATARDPSEGNEENKVRDYTFPDLTLPPRSRCVVAKHTKKEEIKNICQVFPVSQNDASAERTVEDAQAGEVLERTVEDTQTGEVVERTVEDAWTREVEKSTEPPVLMELTNHLENGCIDNFVSKLEDKACDKGDTIAGNSALSIEPLKNGSASECAPSPPFKLIMPVQLKNSEKTPDSENNAKDPGTKRRSYTTSLQISIKLASCLGETQKSTSAIQPKIVNTSLRGASAKRFRNKNSIRSQTSTMDSANGIFKHRAGTTQQENRTVTIHDNSLLRSRTMDGKAHSPSTNCSKSLTTFGCKARQPTVACPFTFKSEERAAKRKEKLEQKMKSREIEKQKPQAKPQVKERHSFKHLRNSIATKATEDTKILSSTDLSNNFPNKISTVRPNLPKLEETASFKDLDNFNSRPRWKISAKTEGLTDPSPQNKRLPSHYNSTKVWKKNSNENASPNIIPL